MFRSGYVGTTVRDIAREAGVPQGSFTNHFRSKEAFTLEVLANYFQHVKDLMDRTVGDTSLTPRQRVIAYLDLITEQLSRDEFSRGCLIGDLSIEAPGHSEAIREQLLVIYDQWRDLFADCLSAAQAAGQIGDQFDAHALADFLLTGWEGAIMRSKVERSRAPLDRFRDIAFTTIFKEES